MSAHTPGPWMAGVGDYMRQECFVVGLSGTTKLVAVLGLTGAEDETESIANACLIAAAPELLEALVYAVKQVPELGTVPGIAAAITKATGGAS